MTLFGKTGQFSGQSKVRTTLPIHWGSELGVAFVLVLKENQEERHHHSGSPPVTLVFFRLPLGLLRTNKHQPRSLPPAIALGLGFRSPLVAWIGPQIRLIPPLKMGILAGTGEMTSSNPPPPTESRGMDFSGFHSEPPEINKARDPDAIYTRMATMDQKGHL